MELHETVAGVAVVPSVQYLDGAVCPQPNGPTEESNSWSVYKRMADGQLVINKTFDDEEEALDAGIELAAKEEVELEAQVGYAAES